MTSHISLEDFRFELNLNIGRADAVIDAFADKLKEQDDKRWVLFWADDEFTHAARKRVAQITLGWLESRETTEWGELVDFITQHLVLASSDFPGSTSHCANLIRMEITRAWGDLARMVRPR